MGSPPASWLAALNIIILDFPFNNKDLIVRITAVLYYKFPKGFLVTRDYEKNIKSKQHRNYRKVHKFSDTRKFCCNQLKETPITKVITCMKI